MSAIIWILRTCSVIFIRVIFAKTQLCKVPHCKLSTQNWFLFFVCVLNKLYAFLMPLLSCFHLAEHETFYICWIHQVDCQLDPSPAVTCMLVMSMLLMSRLMTHHLHYLFHLFSCHALSFPEHSQVWSPWKRSLCPFAFGLWCVFWTRNCLG